MDPENTSGVTAPATPPENNQSPNESDQTQNQSAPATAPADANSASSQVSQEDLAKLKAEIAARDAEIARLKTEQPDWKTRFDEIEQKVEKATQAQSEQIKQTFLKNYAGDDADMKERIAAQYNRLSDPADTPEQIEKKLQDAYLLAERKPITTPFRGSMSSGFQPMNSNPQEKKYGETPEGLDLARKLNMTFMNEKK